jgi:hypothetical protein
MRNCPHCGKPIPAQAIKCRHCKEAVGEAEADAGFENQETYAPEGDHADPFVPQAGPGADHQDPFVPQGGGGDSGEDAFE